MLITAARRRSLGLEYTTIATEFQEEEEVDVEAISRFTATTTIVLLYINSTTLKRDKYIVPLMAVLVVFLFSHQDDIRKYISDNTPHILASATQAQRIIGILFLPSVV